MRIRLCTAAAAIALIVAGLWLVSTRWSMGFSAPPVHPAARGMHEDARETHLAANRAALLRERQELWRTKIEPALAASDAKTAQAIDDAGQAVRRFLDDRRAGSRPFAEAALSWGSKWALIKSKRPTFLGGDGQAQVRYLNDQFARLIFSDEELGAAIASAAAGYLASVQAAENELLVRVRADTTDIPLEALPASGSEEMFRNAFDQTARQIAPMVARELGVDALREMSSFMAGEIATTVLVGLATRMGMSGGLMAAGVGTSWATLGLSIVAAVVVDQVLCWVIDAVRDPVGGLEERIDGLLDDLGGLIVDGDEQFVGLRGRLAEFDQARSEVRRRALRALLFGQEADVSATGTAIVASGEAGMSGE